MHSWTPVSRATLASTDFRLKYSWIRADSRVTAKATGRTHTAASPIGRFIASRQMPTKVVEIMAPASSGT